MIVKSEGVVADAPTTAQTPNLISSKMHLGAALLSRPVV